ncbi:MAG: hypothetical protein [Caudoviricetes sp.]|nr:MAG: hypothetical protein [Caudoviricetes sp.]
MKYTFNTLEEVKTAIEKWFIDLGYDNEERAEKQYLKIIAEVGEMADALCKEDIENFKSEAGDVFVTIVGYCLQTKRNMSTDDLDSVVYGKNNLFRNFDLKNVLRCILDEDFNNSLYYLCNVCNLMNTNLLECATISYNKIQGRLERGELSVKNGTVIKSGN